MQAQPGTLLKKRLWYRCFPVNFGKFLRTPFLQNTSGPLRLVIVKLKRKVEYCGHVLFKKIRPDFLDQNKEFYKDGITRSDLAKVIPQVDCKTGGLGRQSGGISDEPLTLVNFISNNPDAYSCRFART